MSRANGETYFNNFGQTGYEELRDWTPAYYRDINEADANLRFAGSLKDLMADSLEEWVQNQFAASMNEETLSRMERFFYMEDNSSLDIDERRRLLGIAMAGTGKMNTAKIADYVKTYTGAECDFEFRHRLFIFVHLGENGRVGDVATLMEKLGQKIPAHLAFTAQFQTNFIFDWRDLEKINLTKLGIKVGLPFFYTRMLDGSFDLDGTYDLSGGQRVGLGVDVGTKFGFENTTGISLWQKILMPLKLTESITEGIALLLGIETSGGFDFGGTVGCGVETGEDIPLITMTKKGTGAWFLDGSVTLNGAKNLDTIYEKEVIQ